MKKSKKKKNKKRIANNYLGMAAIAIVVLLLLGGLTYQSQTLKAKLPEISLVWSKEMRSYLKKRNKGDFAEKFSGTISFI